jgi:hypothetical protein
MREEAKEAGSRVPQIGMPSRGHDWDRRQEEKLNGHAKVHVSPQGRPSGPARLETKGQEPSVLGAECFSVIRVARAGADSRLGRTDAKADGLVRRGLHGYWGESASRRTVSEPGPARQRRMW